MDTPDKGHDHMPGKMDGRTQEKTFARFFSMVTWGATISVLILIFLALTNS